MSLGDILTKRHVADFLQVTKRTVERRMSEGPIPYVYESGLTSKSLRLAADPSAGKVASASVTISRSISAGAAFLSVSPQMTSGEVSECKKP
jgi:hypothetical protein